MSDANSDSGHKKDCCKNPYEFVFQNSNWDDWFLLGFQR